MLVLLPWTLFRYWADLCRLQRRDWLLTLTAGIFLAAHFGTWISSLAFTNVTSSVVLVQTSPLFVMLLSPLVLGEKPTRRALIGLLLALLGSLAIATSDSCSLPLQLRCLQMLSINDSALKGDFLALLGAITGALYMMLGRSARKTIALIPYITVVYGVSSIVLLVAAIISRLPLTGFSPNVYLWFILLALFPQLLAHSSYNWALKYLPATTVSLSLLGEPVSAAILAYVLLQEGLPPLRWIGAIVVVAGISLALLGPGQALQPEPEVDTIGE